MDPNEAHTRLMSWAEAQLNTSAVDPYGTTTDEAAQLLSDLNEWLSKNGFPPHPWRGYGIMRYNDGYRRGMRDAWKEARDVAPDATEGQKPTRRLHRTGVKTVGGITYVYTIEHEDRGDGFTESLYRTIDGEDEKLIMRGESVTMLRIAADGLSQCEWN